MGQRIHIAIAVHGRFHAFDLAKALSSREDVRVSLLTNHSGKECAKFGIDPSLVISCGWHRWLVRFATRLMPQPIPRWLDALVHESFGRWARKKLEKMPAPPDVIRVFSGVAEEILRSQRLSKSLRLVTRGSSHIRAQRRLLEEEESRAGVQMDKPSDYMLAREEREYALADGVIVLSSFARDTFEAQGSPASKILLIPNAVNLKWYGAGEAVASARRERILSGAPLRVLIVGAFSFRKGILDIARVVENCSGRFTFRFVGDILAEGISLKEKLAGKMEFLDRVPPDKLPAEYAWGDVFFFPTIEDGFPAVLSQAIASGLPTITTPNGSGPDVVKDGTTGWIVPARDAEAMIQRLEWAHDHRQELSTFAAAAASSAQSRTWDDVAADFVRAIETRTIG
jgi:glycosyltransferase involved in cell wall biosynthesis